METFRRLKTCIYKSDRESGQQSVIIQSVLCEVACLKIVCTQYTNTSNTLKTNKQQQACGADKHENMHTQAFAIEFSRRWDH